MSYLLDREIIRYILGSIGFIPPPNFGKVGISTYKLNKDFQLEFENIDGTMEKVSFGLWGGSISDMNSKVKVLATDICDNNNNYHEFSAVYRVDNNNVYGIKHIFEDNGIVLYLVNIDNKWKPVSLFDRLIACAGFEKLNNIGLIWQQENDITDLFPYLMEIIEI